MMKNTERNQKIMKDYKNIQSQRKSGEIDDTEAMNLLRKLPYKYQTFWEKVFNFIIN